MFPLLNKSIAITILVFCATLFATNHVGARLAFDHDLGLILALVARSSLAFLIMFSIVLWQRRGFSIPQGKCVWQLALGVMIAMQSLFLYSAVARIPVAIALLLINTWPIFYTLLNWVFRGRKPSTRLLLLMALILFGLVLVLDIPSWLQQPANVGDQWAPGIAMGTLAALFMACGMWITDSHLTQVSGAIRSSYTMATVAILLFVAGSTGAIEGGFHLPSATQGWIGFGLLTVCYAVASSMLFILAPRLDLANNAPILNAEPVASLLLSYLVLGQTLTPMQLLGAAIVIAGIVLVSLSKQT